jgi:hypothetical protein
VEREKATETAAAADEASAPSLSPPELSIHGRSQP